MCSESRIPIAGEWGLDRPRRDLGLDPPAAAAPAPVAAAVDAEAAAAEAFAQEDAAVRRFRQQATDAILRQDWPSFFEAAADCARAMNARGRIVDAAPVVGFAATLTPRGEAAEVAA